jgi:hypothetical protein
MHENVIHWVEKEGKYENITLVCRTSAECHPGKVRKKLSQKLPLQPSRSCCPGQGCQMVFFQTKNPNFDLFCKALECKNLVYIMAIWYIL